MNFIGLAVTLIINSTHAGPPFMTDDSEPPPSGDWEINLPFIIERMRGETEMEAPLFDFNYGVPNGCPCPVLFETVRH